MAKETMWAQFHKMWTKDVNSINYNKKDWQELEQTILSALKEAKMPVMGPSQNHAYRVGDIITAEILVFLKEKHNLEKPTHLLPFGLKYGAEWVVLENKLKDIIREMVWCDHASSF